MIKWLQNWYYQLCDGEWEHENRIRIESIDNPGWSIEIDISKCGSDILPKSWTLYELSDNNWIGFKIHDHIFYAAGDPFKLELLISLFRELTEKGEITDEYIWSIINSK